MNERTYLLVAECEDGKAFYASGFFKGAADNRRRIGLTDERRFAREYPLVAAKRMKSRVERGLEECVADSAVKRLAIEPIW